MTSEELWEMFEGDLADTCGEDLRRNIPFVLQIKGGGAFGSRNVEAVPRYKK